MSMVERTTNFYENNDHALRPQQIVLRDSLGSLAVQILAAKEDLSQMSDSEMMDKLYKIIDDLHYEYHRHGSFID